MIYEIKFWREAAYPYVRRRNQGCPNIKIRRIDLRSTSITFRRGQWYVYHRVFDLPSLVVSHTLFRSRASNAIAKTFAIKISNKL